MRDHSHGSFFIPWDLYKKVYFMLLYHLRFKDQGCQIGKDQRCRCSYCRHLESSPEQPDKSILINCLFYPLPEIIAKSGQRNRCSTAGKFKKWFVYPDCAKNSSGTNQDHHDPSRKQLRLVHQYLYKHTDSPSDHKRFYIIHKQPYLRSIITACATPGIFCPSL